MSVTNDFQLQKNGSHIIMEVVLESGMGIIALLLIGKIMGKISILITNYHWIITEHL